jgi:PTH1 family peptidyl-tRNA hydrolase
MPDGGRIDGAVIAGLGNPGRQYDGTRHNVGFEAVDELHRRFGSGAWRRQDDALVAEAAIAGERRWLIKPQGYMNVSGGPIAALMNFYKFAPGALVVVHDDIDLPYGALRLRVGGGEGGHNGLKSIVDSLGDPGFGRVRMGVGRPLAAGFDVKAWVLSRFSEEERKTLGDFIALAADAAVEWCSSGLLKAQNKFTRRPKGPEAEEA